MSNITGYITDGTFDKIDVSKISVNKDITDPSTGIIDTDKLNVNTEIETDTIYCKNLVVTENLSIPVENMPNVAKKNVIIDRIQGPKVIKVNQNMGKISYDGTLKDLKATSNTGDKRSVTDTHANITNNTRFKENIMLYGWSPSDGSDTVLHQSNYKDIDIDEHVYYQGCGYIIGFNNPSANQTTEVVTTTEVPETTETTIIPETTQVNVIPEHTITTVVPASTGQTTTVTNKYYNDVTNPNRTVEPGVLSQVPDSGSADQIAFDSHNNLYKTQWQTKKLFVIKTTGEKVELHTFTEYIFSIVIDRDDILWLNTTSGTRKVYKIQLDNGTIVSNDLHVDYINSIPTDFRNLALNSKDELFVITTSGGYIYKLSKTDASYSQYYGPVSGNDPRAMCFDKYDNILYGGRLGKKVYKVTDNGGSPTQSFYAGIVTSIGTIYGLTVDKNNDLYVSLQDLNRIKKITPDGVVTNIMGNGNSNGIVDSSGQPLSSSVKIPGGLAFDKYGDLYVGLAVYPSNDTDHILSLGFSHKDWEDNPVESAFVPESKIYSIDNNFQVDEGQSRELCSTSMAPAVAMTIDLDGYIYVGCQNNSNDIKKISPDGQTQVFISGTGASSCLAVDKHNNVYSGGGNLGNIKKIEPNGTVSTIISGGHIYGIGIDRDNEYLYYVESIYDRVYRVDLLDYNNTEVVCDMRTSSGLPGNPQDAGVSSYDMHLTDNNVLVIHSNRGYLYKIDLNKNNELEFLAGDGGHYDGGHGSGAGYSMGNGADFKLDQMWGITSDENHDLYVGSWSHKVIGKLTLDGIGSLLAGSPGNGNANYNTSISNTTLFTPRALYYKKETGDLYFCDQNGTIVVMAIRPDTPGSHIVNKIYDNPILNLYDGMLDTYLENYPAYDFIVDSNDVRYFTSKNDNKIYSILSDKTLDTFYTETDASFILQNLAIDNDRNIYVTGLDKGIKKIDQSGNATQLTAENAYGEIRGIVVKNNIVHFLSDNKKIYKIHQTGQTIDYNVTASNGKFYLNNVEKPILNLKIGVTYRFIIDNSILANHPFYLTTANVAWAAAVNSIHSGNEVTTNSNNSVITFTPTQERTDFYYQCGNHEGMGNQIIVENNNNPIEISNINDAGVLCGYDTSGMAVDSKGNIYVGENDASQIFKINTSNVISVFAGLNSNYGAVNSDLLSSTFSGIAGMAVDSLDNLYVVSYDRLIVRKLSKEGQVTTVAGIVNTSGNINGQSGTLSQPNGIAVDQHGDIYITQLNGPIRVLGTDNNKIYESNIPFSNDPNFTSPLNQVVTRITTAVPAYMGSSFVIDSNGNYFVCSNSPIGIKKITPDGQISDFWSGTNNFPKHIAIDQNDNLYVSRRSGTPPYYISKITPEGAESQYWTATVGGDSPGPLIVDSNNKLICIIYNYLDSVKNSKICFVENDSLTTIVDISSTLHSKVVNNFNITCMTINSKDELFMCELMNDYGSFWNGARILKYSFANGLTLFTTNTSSGNNNYQPGLPSQARFNHPSGITIDKNDNLYVIEENMYRLVKITPQKRVTTVAGLQYSGNDDGDFSTARFNTPIDIKIDNYGIINVLDKHSGNIRSINLGLTDKLVNEVIVSNPGTSLPFQQIHDFPDIMNQSDWILTLTFNHDGSATSSSRIIGGTDDQLTTSEWGLLLGSGGATSQRSFYLKIWGSIREAKIYALPNVNYKLSITKTPNGNSFSYVFVLDNLDNNTSSTVTFYSFSSPTIPTTHPVFLGGSWLSANHASRFSGIITEVTYQSSSYNGTYILTPPPMYSIREVFSSPPQSVSRTIQESIAEHTVTTVVPETTETIVIPETTVTTVIPGYTTTVITNTEVFTPIAFMSRLDYFVVTIDSFSNTTSFPVNFLDISLYDSVDTDLRMNVVRKDTKFKLELKVNSNKEVKWFAVINLKKIYLKNALNRLTDDKLKYNTSDNLINWQPVVSSTSYDDLCFKFVEGLEFRNISPFSSKVVTDQATFTDSVIDDSLVIETKQLKRKVNDDPQSVREIVDGTLFLDEKSSAFDYNTYGYHSTFLIQPSYNNIKRLTTSYSHSSYFLNNNNNKETVTYENEFGNSFTKISTKDASNFSTSRLIEDTSDTYLDEQLVNSINNKKINFIFQLKEKEHKYQPVLAILYYRMFNSKAFDDKLDSIAHRDFAFEKNNLFDIAENLKINLQLYKNISDFTQDIPKQIFLTQKDSGLDEIRYFDLGTHHFIKSYINIRDITNNKNVFFTHYASVVIPAFSVMRQFFTQKKEEGITDLNVMKTKFIEKYINSNSIINELDTNSYDDGNNHEYTMDSPCKYINENGKKYIDENTDNINLIKFDLKIETEPLFEQNIIDNIVTNSIEAYNDIETAYNSFDVKFPIKVICTAKNTSKFQVNVLLEINKFNLDTY